MKFRIIKSWISHQQKALQPTMQSGAQPVIEFRRKFSEFPTIVVLGLHSSSICVKMCWIPGSMNICVKMSCCVHFKRRVLNICVKTSKKKKSKAVRMRSSTVQLAAERAYARPAPSPLHTPHLQDLHTTAQSHSSATAQKNTEPVRKSNLEL